MFKIFLTRMYEIRENRGAPGEMIPKLLKKDKPRTKTGQELVGVGQNVGR